MKTNLPLNPEQFSKRLADLCLKSGLADFPKDELDQHILLKSAMLSLGPAASFTEKELSEKLDLWSNQITQLKAIDRVTMRRRLVDTGYLLRSKDGATYQVAQPGPRPQFFEPAVDQVDIPGAITAARAEAARRKQAFLEKSKGK